MGHLPLEGIKVLEIAAYISGPYAGALLAGLGAEVVKVEPQEGDAFRIGMGGDSPFFVQYNAGKKSVVIDLKSPEGIKAVKAMLPRFDVLIENMRPGKLATLGLSPEVCREINPRLIYASVSGFGSGGPLADRPAYDSIGQSFGGVYSIMNDPGDVRLTGTCMADLITGVIAALGIAAGLTGRERDPSHHGVRVETSVLEGMSALTIDAMTQALSADIDPVRGTRHPQGQLFCAKTGSGDYIVVHLSSSQKFWRALMSVLGREDLLEDPRFKTYAARAVPAHYAALVETVTPEFLKRSREEWERLLAEADVPFAPALTMRQVAAHPQTQWLELLEPAVDGHTLVRPPWRFDGKRPRRTGRAAEIGADTREILQGVMP